MHHGLLLILAVVRIFLLPEADGFCKFSPSYIIVFPGAIMRIPFTCRRQRSSCKKCGEQGFLH